MSSNSNIYACFKAGFDPEAPFLDVIDVIDGDVYRYADLDVLSAQVANFLSGLGLVPGDCVSVVCKKSPELLWLYLGCIRAGYVYHPLNASYTENELAFFLRDASTRVVFCDQSLETRVAGVARDCAALKHVVCLDGEQRDGFRERLASASRTFATYRSSADDVAALIYSSGTTGTPKGIPLTHGNLYENAFTLMETWRFSRSDVLLHVLPLYHVHGLFVILGPALLAGMQIRFLSRFEPTSVIKALPSVSIMAGVPTYYTRLLATDGFTSEICSKVRVFISGSAPLSDKTFISFKERTQHTILERYGMSETGILTSNPLMGVRKPSSVGLPLKGVDLRIVDDKGSPARAGSTGEIEVRGENVFSGYQGLSEVNRDSFREGGFFRTGDQGYLDEEGYLFIVGRSKDIIITGGMNVYPKEIEREIDAFPNVVESAVFGVPHHDFGEATIAAVVAESHGGVQETELLIGLKRKLAGYKIPKRILMVDELPRNTMGKIQKTRLRERFNDLFSKI